MRIIKPLTIHEYIKKHATAKAPLSAWMLVASRASWRSIGDVRQTYPHADAVLVGSNKTVTVFNIGGNKYRLIVAIHYNRQKVFVRDFMTHAEYNRQSWKGRH